MKRLAPTLLAAALAALVPASPAVAGKNDDAWAKCLWEQVPTSVANWLAMPPPKGGGDLNEPDPASLLQFRLLAACYERLTPPGKRRPPSFNAKKVRPLLVASRPAAIGPDQRVPDAYRCDHYFEDDTEMKTRAGSDWGYGDPRDRKILSSVRSLFAGTKGGSVALAEGAGLHRCRTIRSDGTFADG
jgi:hypothetical protein